MWVRSESGEAFHISPFKAMLLLNSSMPIYCRVTCVLKLQSCKMCTIQKHGWMLLMFLEVNWRGVSLALCTDDVNPFAHNRVVYSMWPIMLTLLNLPWRLRIKLNILLVGIVLGNERKEAKKLEEVLVDELLEISSLTSMMPIQVVLSRL